MTDSVDLINQSEVQKKMVEIFNSQDKERLVLEKVSENDDSLNLQNVRISNKAIEKEEIREGVETTKQNDVHTNLSSIWSQLLQDDKDLNSKLTTSLPMLTMDSSPPLLTTNPTYKINHEFNSNENSLIYLLTLKICRKQYVRQTVYIFFNRWNNYKTNDRKYLVGKPCMQEHIFEHFNSESHTDFLENVCYTY